MIGAPVPNGPAGRRLSSRNGTSESRTKPAAANSHTNSSSVKKHCGSPENCVNTNDSPGTGDAFDGRVFRENVKTKSAAPCLATRAASRTARRKVAADSARFQIPCATNKSHEWSRSGRASIGLSVHATCPDKRRRRIPSAAAVIIGSDRSRPTTFQPCAASGIAFRPAPQPMSKARRRARRRSSCSANLTSVTFGGELTKRATISGLLHVKPASGSVTTPHSQYLRMLGSSGSKPCDQDDRSHSGDRDL